MKLIQEYFVPVALTLYGDPKDEEGKFWTSIFRQGGWGTGRFHAVTPAGRMLCGGDQKPGCGGGSCDPRKALERWRALPEVERRPGAVKVEDLREMDPEFPKRPPESLILKGYNRPLGRRPDGELERLKEYRDCQELSRDGANWKTFVEPEPGRTWVWLSEVQWRSLVPSDPAPGRSFPVAEEVADRIVRLSMLNTLY